MSTVNYVHSFKHWLKSPSWMPGLVISRGNMQDYNGGTFKWAKVLCPGGVFVPTEEGRILERCIVRAGAVAQGWAFA